MRKGTGEIILWDGWDPKKWEKGVEAAIRQLEEWEKKHRIKLQGVKKPRIKK